MSLFDGRSRVGQRRGRKGRAFNRGSPWTSLDTTSVLIDQIGLQRGRRVGEEDQDGSIDLLGDEASRSGSDASNGSSSDQHLAGEALWEELNQRRAGTRPEKTHLHRQLERGSEGESSADREGRGSLVAGDGERWVGSETEIRRL